MTGNADVRADFRGDINGLRALAVSVVILYHFGIPGFGGGFVGVDVFFVISGFLMTGIVVRGLERGDLSLIGFYMARARRIVPALVFLCAVLLGLGWFVLMPPDYKTLGTHVAYSLSFLSNVEYWLEAGYFDLASHEKWLLHTWSLSVEWQFYLLLPMVLWGVWRMKPGRTAQVWTLLIGLMLSLAACAITTGTYPKAAFFLLHTRAWEMLGGGLVYMLAQVPKFSIYQRRWLEAAGLLLILVSVMVFDKESVWPGWWATLPVSATMMVLAANRLSPWTGNKVAQWLGDRSYSLYLWHWPVYVALVYLELRDDRGAVAIGLALTLLLGHGSYVWIENTSRRRLARVKFRRGVSALVAAPLVVAVLAAAIWSQNGVAGRFAPAIELAAAEGKNFNPRRGECHPNHGSKSPSCVYGGTDWRVIVAGDSHADALVSGVAQAQQQGAAGVVEWSYSGCAFVPGMKQLPHRLAQFGHDYRCSAFIEWERSRLDALPGKIPLVMANRYGEAAFGRNEDRTGSDVPDVYFSKVYSRTTPQFLDEFARNITSAACALAKRRKVYLVRPIPEMGFNVPRTLSRRMIFGMSDDLSISMSAYRRRNAWVWAAQDAARDQCGIKILDPTLYLCHEDRCYGSRNGRPLYHDDDHLSEFGNKLLVPMFAEVFRDR